MKIKNNSWKISGPELGTPKAPNTHLSPLSKLAYKKRDPTKHAAGDQGH